MQLPIREINEGVLREENTIVQRITDENLANKLGWSGYIAWWLCVSVGSTREGAVSHSYQDRGDLDFKYDPDKTKTPCEFFAVEYRRRLQVWSPIPMRNPIPQEYIEDENEALNWRLYGWIYATGATELDLRSVE